jgi:hypothetical protein
VAEIHQPIWPKTTTESASSDERERKVLKNRGHSDEKMAEDVPLEQEQET